MREPIRWALILSALIHIGVQGRSAWRSRGRGRHAGAIWISHPAGSPSLTGCYLACVLPLAPWPLWPIFGLGLWLASSWLAIVALGGAWALTGALSMIRSP